MLMLLFKLTLYVLQAIGTSSQLQTLCVVSDWALMRMNYGRERSGNVLK